MLAATKYNLANLLNFEGRNSRETFWFYILFLFIVQFAISFAFGIAMVVEMFSGIIAGAKAGMSEEAIQARMSASMGDWMGTITGFGMFSGLVMVLLMAASFVRRLHDSDHSGRWALLAFGLQFAAAAYSFTMLDELRDLMALSMNPETAVQAMERQAEFSRLSLFTYGPLLLIVGFGVLKSSHGPNRFGDAPAQV